jgi:AhpD family alkylhydroperoxidase
MPVDEAPQRRLQLRAGIRELHRTIPEQMRGFGELHRAAMAEGALSTAHKELIALAISICDGCEDCIALHLHDALDAGATADQVTETIGVALLMGGGPASVYATKALGALQQFQAVAAP